MYYIRLQHHELNHVHRRKWWFDSEYIYWGNNLGIMTMYIITYSGNQVTPCLIGEDKFGQLEPWNNCFIYLGNGKEHNKGEYKEMVVILSILRSSIWRIKYHKTKRFLTLSLLFLLLRRLENYFDSSIKNNFQIMLYKHWHH